MRARRLLILVLFVAVTSLRSAPDCLLPLPSSETQRVITHADAVYVFPYTDSARDFLRAYAHGRTNEAQHQVDRKDWRLLGRSARERLVAILGDSHNWEQLGFVIEPPAQLSVGVVFRTSTDELVLFFNPISVDGAFRSCFLSAVLKDQPRAQLEKWKRRYARSEIEGR